jgi:hypothetical protein
MNRFRDRATLAGALCAVAALCLLLAAPAGAGSLVPRGNKVFFGTSDTGDSADFGQFSSALRKHPALIQTFRTWGSDFPQSIERWQAARARPVLHINTADSNDGHELISPRGIAAGGGDDYLIRLNKLFATKKMRAYIRPLGEPNRCRNVYAAFTCDGAPRRGAHYPYWYRQAFRRIATIVRGGATLEQINATLASIGLPPLNRSRGPPPRSLPAAPVAIVWSPLPGGSPRVRGNLPGNFWPGGEWVDWVGTDFYARYPVWRDLNRFFTNRHWRRKPFSLTEWAVAGVDDPRWTRQVFAWTFKRPRVRMLIYYRGFGATGNPYALGAYPRTAAVIRQKIRRATIPPYAPFYATPPPPPPPPPPPAPAPAP